MSDMAISSPSMSSGMPISSQSWMNDRRLDFASTVSVMLGREGSAMTLRRRKRHRKRGKKVASGRERFLMGGRECEGRRHRETKRSENLGMQKLSKLRVNPELPSLHVQFRRSWLL